MNDCSTEWCSERTLSLCYIRMIDKSHRTREGTVMLPGLCGASCHSHPPSGAWNEPPERLAVPSGLGSGKLQENIPLFHYIYPEK